VLQRPLHRLLFVACAAGLLWLATSDADCRGERGSLYVVVSSELPVGSGLDKLTARVRRVSDGGELYSESVGLEELHSLPITFHYLSGKTTPRGTELEVTVEASLRGARVGEANGVARLERPPGGTLRLRLSPLPASVEGNLSPAPSPSDAPETAGDETSSPEALVPGGSPRELAGGGPNERDAGPPDADAGRASAAGEATATP
jgi:hypothetical protein